MNNAPPSVREQCDLHLTWMQDRIEELLLEKLYDEAYALYMEWHEWVEIDDFTLITIRDEAK